MRCRAIDPARGPAGPAIQALAAFRLSLQQSLSVARGLKRCRSCGSDLAPLANFRLGIVASGTFDLLLDCIPAAGARHGIAFDICPTPYGQAMQQALDPTSDLNRARADAVLVSVDHRWLHLDRPILSGSATAAVNAAIERLRALVHSFKEHGGATAILQTLATPPDALFGSYERRVRGTVRALIAEVNDRIVELAQETTSYLLDAAALAERIGTDRWFDAVQWTAYKFPFSADCFPAYADMLGRLVGSIRGKARKCLVLDLDNTIWGGVIGDDGLEGIQIGQGSSRSEAYLSVQQAAVDLRDRGILLAVCSKNNDGVARAPFRDHPEMLLRENHIAVFQANWIDKPSNIKAIARTLNLGLDALVVLDDNPAERAQIRAALPMVAVPELPAEPGCYPWYLAAAGYFEAVGFSTEDRLRAESYTADAQRADVMAQARDLGEYLTSLGMTITFSAFDRQSRQRIVQLINKTNQFNLTTRRYTEAEVAEIERDNSIFTLQVRLTDKFGDLGMVAVVICRQRPTDESWYIDTWLMSCRVLGRRVEEAMLATIVAQARKRGIRRVVGSYIPTAKNDVVRDLYSRLGFDIVNTSADRIEFELALVDFPGVRLPFEVRDRLGPERGERTAADYGLEPVR